MIHCIACHRQLKNPRASGMGPVCEKRNPPAPPYECDLLGLDLDRACEAARALVVRGIEIRATEARFAIRKQYRQAVAGIGVLP